MGWSATGSHMGTRWYVVRSRVLKASGGKCYMCGEDGAVEVDHVVPRSRGGSDHPDNLRAVCKVCHLRKSSAEGHAAKRRRRELRKRPADKHPGRFDAA